MTPWEALTLSRDSEFIQIDRHGVFRCSLSELVDSIKSEANAELQAEIAELKAKLAEQEKRYPKSAAETHPRIPNSKCKCEHWQRCPECTPSLKGTP